MKTPRTYNSWAPTPKGSRIVHAIRRPLPLLVLAAVCACDDSTIAPDQTDRTGIPGGLPTDPPEFTIWYFDGYAGDRQVRLYWDSTLFMDWGPPAPELTEVKIWVSVSGPSNDFSLAKDDLKPAAESGVIPDLVNGASHYFRLTAHDAGGAVVAASRPICVQPGKSLPPVVSIPAPQIRPTSSTLQYNRNVDWSSDARQLAFAMEDASGTTNLFVLTIDDLSVEQMTHFTDGRASTPDWSPSQDRIAYTRRDPRHGRWGYRVWVSDLNSGTAGSVSSGEVDFSPCWLSGAEILFCKGTASPPNIPELTQVSLLDGTETGLTADQEVYKYDPARSPNAGTVVYSGYGDEGGSGFISRSLRLFDLSSGESLRITENRFWDDVTPTWSPDGGKVFFASNRSGHFEIWVLDPQTRQTRQVTRSVERGAGNFNGAVSPDGVWLATFRSTGSESWLELRAR